ncbi:MAG TPA: HypC/HybG/HupF family hydrogenase formation chaperone [Vulgatibacter sp.]|nr:HypC/HybG/HupF family hydrogenase formation chaperone [Vulgatibacter sp.]
MCLAIPGELVELADKDGLRFGKVRFGGIRREVCLEYQPEAKVGDFVLVHVGFAISTLDREEAARTLEVLRQIGQTSELDEEEAARLGLPSGAPEEPFGARAPPPADAQGGDGRDLPGATGTDGGRT